MLRYFSAVICATGSSGGFFGPSISGFLKQWTGGDAVAFLGLPDLGNLEPSHLPVSEFPFL